jgi:hypothetical protein
MAWQDREKEWKNLQTVQQKVGEICMIWATLDFKVDQLLADFLDIGPAQVAALMNGMDFSRKCEAVRKLLVLSGPSPEWIAEIDSIMLDLANGLNKKRNRYVHDMWQFEIDAINRIERKATIQKQQARKSKTLSFDKEIPVTVEEMDALCKRGYAILGRFYALLPALIP